MAIVLQRLQHVLNKQQDNTTDGPASGPASLTGHIDSPAGYSKASAKTIFKLLVEEDASLVLEYNMLRLLLQETLIAWKAAEQGSEQKQALENDTIHLVREALHLSTLLDEKYCHYINDRPNLRKATLENHHTLYRRWLHVHVNHVLLQGCQNPPKVDMPFADEIRSIFERSNPYRLGALRTRRLLIALIPILNQFEQYGPWIRWLDGFAAPAFSYINLLFFLPRLMLNTYTLGSHWIENASMSPEERSLGATARFNAQWDRLWPNLTNDIAWATNAALVFFVFTGALQPYGVYLGLGSQLHDLLLSSLRGYQEMCRLYDLAQQYQALHEEQPGNAQITAYLSLLHKRINAEEMLLLVSITNFSVLFFVAILAFPSIAALSPWVPVVGAGMSVIITIFNFGGRSYLTPAGAMKVDNLLTCDIQAEAPVVRRNLTAQSSRSSSCLLSDYPSSFISNPPRRCSSTPQLRVSPLTISTAFSHGLFPRSPSPKKEAILASTSRDDFFFREIDGNSSTSVKL